jgi:GNAT superfamily N-acetyltransferase
MPYQYLTDYKLSAAEFIALLSHTSLGERRPLDDLPRVEAMLRNASLVATAWDSTTLIGVARCVTDSVYCCYLSDLAVHERYQKQGVGRQLITTVQSQLHPDATIILIAAPKARQYYGPLGLEQHPSAWTLKANQPITGITC